MGIIAYLLYGSLAVAAAAYATVWAHNSFDVAWWAAYLIGINVTAFVFYAYDKIFAGLLNALKLRVPEAVLKWELALPGGIVGAVLAMYLLNHKTSDGECPFRMDLAKAFAVQAILVLLAIRWAHVPVEQVNAFVANLAGRVVTTVQQLVAAARAAS